MTLHLFNVFYHVGWASFFSIFGLYFETVWLYFCLSVPMVVSYCTANSGNNSPITLIVIRFLTRETIGVGAR